MHLILGVATGIFIVQAINDPSWTWIVLAVVFFILSMLWLTRAAIRNLFKTG